MASWSAVRGLWLAGVMGWRLQVQVQVQCRCSVGGVVWRAGVRSGAVAGWSDGMAAAAGTDRAPAAGYSAGD